MSSFLQSRQWARFRESLGWKAHWLDNLLILERPLLLGKSFLYAPEVEIREVGSAREVVKNLQTIRFQHRPIFFRLELLDELNKQNQNIIPQLEQLGFVKAFEEVQPEWRQIIDLNQPDDELLAKMKPKGRYNISVAKRHKIVVSLANPSSRTQDWLKTLKTFHHLYQLTTERAKVSSRSINYFKKLSAFFPTESQIFIASYQNKPLATALIIFWGDTATYLYGGSSSEDRQVMAPYLLHWAIIKEAKKRGCKKYDMGAVAPQPTTECRVPSAKRAKKLSKKYTGITRFKQQFGGRTVQVIGNYDLIFKPIWYMLFRFVEGKRR